MPELPQGPVLHPRVPEERLEELPQSPLRRLRGLPVLQLRKRPPWHEQQHLACSSTSSTVSMCAVMWKNDRQTERGKNQKPRCGPGPRVETNLSTTKPTEATTHQCTSINALHKSSGNQLNMT